VQEEKGVIIMAKSNEAQGLQQPPTPDPALKRLERLVGTWALTGRTLDSDVDNISGQFTIEWMPGGFFMIQHGEWNFVGMPMKTLEICTMIRQQTPSHHLSIHPFTSASLTR
jgi:hypothetical protein